MSGFLGSKQTGVQTTKSEPPEYALPYLEKAMAGAEDLYENYPQTYYPEKTYTDYSPETMAAIGAGEQRAADGSSLLTGAQDFTSDAMGGSFVNPAQAMLQKTAQGDFLSGNNEYLQAAMAPAMDNIKGQFSAGGRLGSGANIAAMTSAMAPVYAQNYARERQNQMAAQGQIGALAQQGFANQMNAARMAPQLAQADYADIDRAMGYGQMRDAKSSEALQDAINRHNFTQAEPQQRLQNYIAAIRGGTFGGQTTRPIYSSPFSQGIGNAANLGFLYKMMT